MAYLRKACLARTTPAAAAGFPRDGKQARSPARDHEQLIVAAEGELIAVRYGARASAADLKSLTKLRQNRIQGLQIESGTRIICLPVPITFRSPRKGVAEM
jgi:hypothetical protein